MSIHWRFLPLVVAALAFLILAGTPSDAQAQFGRRLQDAVKRTAEDKAIQKATDEESKAIDKAVAGGDAADTASSAASGAVPSSPAAPAAAGKLYDALAEKGRVATQGISFEAGTDEIRPESTPTLKEIGAMLKEHPELKLMIEGHTDNVGTANANLALSVKRANAVRQFLVDTYQIDAARLEAKGLGQTKPAGSNDTPEGRQSNQRVELVKL